MTDRVTSREVFIQEVKDHLDGTPHAHHPVQFVGVIDDLDACTLCGAVVAATDAAHDRHRGWHDLHVRVHDEILRQALRHVPEPRYGR